MSQTWDKTRNASQCSIRLEFSLELGCVSWISNFAKPAKDYKAILSHKSTLWQRPGISCKFKTDTRHGASNPNLYFMLRWSQSTSNPIWQMEWWIHSHWCFQSQEFRICLLDSTRKHERSVLLCSPLLSHSASATWATDPEISNITERSISRFKVKPFGAGLFRKQSQNLDQAGVRISGENEKVITKPSQHDRMIGGKTAAEDLERLSRLSWRREWVTSFEAFLTHYS